jgi:hypothetical protein
VPEIPSPKHHIKADEGGPKKITTNNGRRRFICRSDKHLMQRDTTFHSDPRQGKTNVNEPKSEDMSHGKPHKIDEHSRNVHSVKESGAVCD